LASLRVFGVAELLAFCSRSFTLAPGDVLLTGTPWGCGEFMTPPRLRHPGHIVEAEMESIGILHNPVAGPEAMAGSRRWPPRAQTRDANDLELRCAAP
jgi:hypothetical protein